MNKLRTLCGGTMLLGLSLCLARLHPFGNPRSAPQQTRDGLLHNSGISEKARQILIAKCADCHSDATHWTIASRTAPASWLIERDVAEGRRHLNLSHWQELSTDQRAVLAQQIVQRARSGSMPPLQYRILHWQANLAPTDGTTLAKLAEHNENGGSIAPGDAARGESLFERRCTGCHSLDVNREGPHLRGVYGRRAGSVSDFEYSASMRDAGLFWTDSNLDRWLTDTDAMIPGNNMGFSVPKAQDRTDLIAFLRSVNR
jgi:cytochrome c